jgi:hypothetical protein
MDLPRDQTYAVLNTFSAAALAAVLSVLILFIFRLWGNVPAAAALVFCLLSTGFNLFSWSLFWAVFLDLAPTAWMAIFALSLPSRSRIRHVLGFAVLAVLLILTLANGYEFMTTTMAAPAVPFFAIYAAGRITLKSLIRYVIATFLVGLAAFAVTLAIHNAFYVEAFGSSGFDWVGQRNARWTPSLTSFAPIDVAKVLSINAVDISGVGLPNALLLLAGLPFLFIAARTVFARRSDQESSRIALLIGAAMLASLSWILLQFPHVAFHPRFSSILVSFPFGIFLCAGLARLWQLRSRPGERGSGQQRETAAST